MLGTQQFQVWRCVVPCTVLGLLALNWEMTVLSLSTLLAVGPLQ